MHREVRVGATEASNDVVFKRLYSLFGCVSSVQMRGHKLEVDGFGPHEAFKTSGGFIVQFLENGSHATLDKRGVDNGVCEEEFSLQAILHRLR
jgi:hypothetical protein